MYFTKVLGEIRISVRLRVCEVNLVVIVLKSVGECERVIAPLVVCLLGLVFPVVVLEVA